jgi:hypothetical protein
VAFLDEDELQPGSGGGSRRSGAERQRQLMLRRVIALVVGVLLIILLLLAVRGCLNARKERGFESYSSDLATIVEQSNQLSTEFFNRLEDPEADADPLELEAQIASDRGTAEGLLQRVEGLDTPDELAGAQAELEQAFELRRDALAGIADDIPTALGSEGRPEAIERIAQDMREFLASDVLFARSRADINAVLAEQGAGDTLIDESVFLGEPVEQWLDQLQLTTILSTFAGDAGATEGIHGLALLSTSIGKTELTAGTENPVSLGSGAPEITVEVENQGDQEEREVSVQYTLSGGVTLLQGEGVIPRLDAGGFEEVTMGLDDVPDTETPLTLEVEVLPVPGEESADNNAATYTVTFD